MPFKNHLSSAISSTLPMTLYSSAQLYAIEQDWFAQGYNSFALMQQAAWQMAQRIVQLEAQNYNYLKASLAQNAPLSVRSDRQPSASIWVGQGNNGGDGWLIAHYLQQAGWQVQVISVGIESIEDSTRRKKIADTNSQATESEQVSDALRAQRQALAAKVDFVRFEDSIADKYLDQDKPFDNDFYADVYVDALFGIGLDRAPTGIYKQAIETFNQATNTCGNYSKPLVVAVDIPSGLVASTGQVFEHLAIKADITLCLIARKFGLHTKDGSDCAGIVIDIPLIPFKNVTPAATLLHCAQRLPARQQNSYKGSYGHVLIIGGNRIGGSQGMGGAAILAASSAMATGAGKITVACHDAFHGAILTSLPDAMTIDLHDIDGVKQLIKEASVIAIGMGLGRDKKAEDCFIHYIEAAIAAEKSLVIDADGLYHLATLQAEKHELVEELTTYSNKQQVYLTPHSGEAARLLDKQISEVENDRLAAIKHCATTYGGNWVLKGVGSLVLEQGLAFRDFEPQIYVCAVGNAGMATAGMGDILTGICAGLLAQLDLSAKQRSLSQAVLVHGLAGEVLASQNAASAYGNNQSILRSALMIGQRGMQAQHMPAAVSHVMEALVI